LLLAKEKDSRVAVPLGQWTNTVNVGFKHGNVHNIHLVFEQDQLREKTNEDLLEPAEMQGKLFNAIQILREKYVDQELPLVPIWRKNQVILDLLG
jgi:hypothetical protein